MSDELQGQAETPAEPTNDNLTAPEAPAAATEAAEPAAEAVETVETAETVDTETEVPAEGDEPKRKIPGSQRLKRRLQLIESEFDRVARENEELKRQVPRGNGAPEGKPGIDREPQEADFPNDYFSFERAKVAWDVRQAVRGEIERERATAQERARREIVAERFEAHEENVSTARERIPDFDKVVNAALNISIKPELADEILASEKSALLQYHLAKNPDKVRELNGMTGRELAREIGRLESRVHLPTAKKATQATPPPTQIKGGAAPAFDPNKSDDMEAYVKWRAKGGGGPSPYR